MSSPTGWLGLGAGESRPYRRGHAVWAGPAPSPPGAQIFAV